MKIRCWYSVHGTIEASPTPSAMLASLRPRVDGLAYDFEPHDESWCEGRFRLSDKTVPAIHVRRARAGDEGFDDLARLEKILSEMDDEPHRDFVLAHIRRTCQSVHVIPLDFTLGMSKLARMCEQLCGYLARETEGLIQVFQEGFFSAEGESLLPHCPRHKLKTKSKCFVRIKSKHCFAVDATAATSPTFDSVIIFVKL